MLSRVKPEPGTLAQPMKIYSNVIRWGIVGCGDVTEVKSGPGFQKAEGSTLLAVMRRDRARAEEFARRHGVPRVHTGARDLMADPDVDAVYIATPPDTHRELALMAAAEGKPCLVEKPMALDHAQCVAMVEAFETRGLPLWVAYYRRALPRFLLVRDLLASGAIGKVTSVHVEQFQPLATGDAARAWRVDPAIGGGGIFVDMGSHSLDLLDFLLGPIAGVSGWAINTGGAYRAEDVTAVAFRFGGSIAGTGLWNFNAAHPRDGITFTGSAGEIVTPVFVDGDVLVRTASGEQAHPVRNPPHVHQPLIQSIVDEMHGRGRCDSTSRSAARTSWVIDACIGGYYRGAASGRAGAPGEGVA
jgi:1,5-anhydro-D-fructose reductase (1,5-anhydro-D-mannitol-forming)